MVVEHILSMTDRIIDLYSALFFIMLNINSLKIFQIVFMKRLMILSFVNHMKNGIDLEH